MTQRKVGVSVRVCVNERGRQTDGKRALFDRMCVRGVQRVPAAAQGNWERLRELIFLILAWKCPKALCLSLSNMHTLCKFMSTNIIFSCICLLCIDIQMKSVGIH